MEDLSSGLPAEVTEGGPEAPDALVLRAEVGCHPLWPASEAVQGRDVDPRRLGLSDATVERLQRWAAWYDATLDHERLDHTRFASESEAASFDAEGRELWRTLQGELAGRHTVSYWSTGERRMLMG